MTRQAWIPFFASAFLAFAPCASALTGGPDAGGYRFTDSTEPGPPIAFNFVPIAGTVVALTDDSFSPAEPIGFTFNYYGTDFTTVRICSNGFLSFVGDSTSFNPTALPTSSTPNNMIAGDWTDLNPSLGGTISFTTTGAAPNRVFTAEWLNIQHFGGGFPVRFQISLLETTNNIELQIDDGGSDGSDNTAIGIENAGGTVGLTHTFVNTAAPGIDNLAVRFAPDTPNRVTDLAAAGSSTTTITVNWTHAGDRGTLGTAVPGPDLRFSPTNITNQADYDAAPQTAPQPAQGAGGTPGGPLVVAGLNEGDTRFFAIEYLNAAGNRSILSNVVSGTTLNVPPSAVADLACGVETDTTIPLTWTQSGDDGMAGTATTLDLRFSFTPMVTQADFDAATAVVPPATLGPGGTPGAYTITGLPPDTTVFIGIQYTDEVGNRPAPSFVTCGTLDLVAPSAITDLQIISIVGTVVAVQWTNTGDNGVTGTATAVDLRMRLDGCFSLIAGNFAGAAVPPIVDVAGEPAPTGPGTVQTFTFDTGAFFSTFSVGMVVRDEVPNTSAVSNQPVCGVTAAPAWLPPVPGSDSGGGISNTADASVDPCMDINPTTNQPGVVWTDRDTVVENDLEIFMRESNGAAFQELDLSGSGDGLSDNATPSQFSRIAYDVLGQAVVAWQDVDDVNGDADIYVRRFEAGAWAEMAASGTGSGISTTLNNSSTGPSVEINPVGGQPGVAWVEFSLGDFEIFFREFDPAALPAATWVERANSGQGQGVSGNGGVSLQPSLAFDAAGQPVIAWADNSSGNYEIYVRGFNIAANAWVDFAGSGTGGGISQSPTQVSQNPAVQVGAGGNLFVVWQETLPTGNVEIYGRQFNGAAWVDFGPGSAATGGISITPGRSITPELCMHPALTDVFLCVWADFSDPQGDSEIYAKWFDNGQWREIGTSSARLGGISDTAGQSLSPCCGITNAATPTAFVSWQEFSGTNYEVFVRSLILVGPVPDSNHEFVVGGGTGGRGEYRVFDNGTAAFAPLDLRVVPFAAAYNANPGALHPACGDVDGDGVDEVILGQGPFPGGAGGFVAVIRDHTQRFDQLAMLRFPWTAYNNANGAVYPAAGDVDGDGRDEIVMGMGTFAGGGLFAVFDDSVALFAFRRFVRAASPAYSSLNGEIHPACGDVDGDGVDEIIVGLGRGGAGLVTVRDDMLRNFVGIGAMTYPNAAYNSANGTTWPSCGNLTGGVGAETVVGPGRGGSGLAYIFGDRALGFKRVGGLQFPWSRYNTSVGEVRPAVGNLDPDLALEVVGGTGPFPGAGTGGFLFVFNNVTTGATAAGQFVQYVNTNATYNNTNGETFPATGQLR